MVQKEAMKAFKEIKGHEYRLLQLYKPHKIHQNMDQFIDEMRKKEKESTVELDPKRL
jgi:L-serine deaminase